MKKTTNKLDASKTIKLSDWLRANWQEYEGASDVDVAEFATSFLGFEVGASSVSSVCKALGIQRRKSRPPAAPAVVDGVPRGDMLMVLQVLRRIELRQVHKPSEEIDALIEAYSARS